MVGHRPACKRRCRAIWSIGCDGQQCRNLHQHELSRYQRRAMASRYGGQSRCFFLGVQAGRPTNAIHLTRQVAVDYTEDNIVCNAGAPVTGRTDIAIAPACLCDNTHALAKIGRTGRYCIGCDVSCERNGDLLDRHKSAGGSRLEGWLRLRRRSSGRRDALYLG
jgi:hypothetical protein